ASSKRNAVCCSSKSSGPESLASACAGEGFIGHLKQSQRYNITLSFTKKNRAAHHRAPEPKPAPAAWSHGGSASLGRPYSSFWPNTLPVFRLRKCNLVHAGQAISSNSFSVTSSPSSSHCWPS